MASLPEVKRYLAYWFQLGKKVIINNGTEELLPQPVVRGDRYSSEFERCWQIVTNPKNRDCYLEGTSQTIQELLSPQWAITPCARCDMPVPMIELGAQEPCCTCSDLENWPNNELPPPREPVDNQGRLNQIRHSVAQAKDRHITQKKKTNGNGKHLKTESDYALAPHTSENHKPKLSPEKSPLPPGVSDRVVKNFPEHNED